MAPHMENKDVDEQGMKQLRDWMAKQPHLPAMPDKLVARMLYSCYGSVERTKTTIDNFVTIITHAPELFENLSALDEDYQKAMRVIQYVPLEELSKEGFRQILFRLQDADPNKFDMVAAFKAVLATFAILMEADDRLPGYVIMIDFSGMAMGHLMKVNMTCIKQLIVFVQEALPIRLKGIYFINSVPLVQNLLNLIKPLMKKELMGILHVFTVNEMPKFYAECMTKSMMPAEYGGKDRKCSDMHADTLKRVEENISYLRFIDSLRVDESKRVGKSKTSSDIFGIQGSFKKLDLD